MSEDNMNKPHSTPEQPIQPQPQPQPQQTAPQLQQAAPQPQRVAPQGNPPMQGQNMSNGGSVSGQPSMENVKYAGFWIRFLAVIIDGLILGVAMYAVQAVTGIQLIVTDYSMEAGQASANTSWLGTVIQILYMTVTTGSSLQATLGKKILGLRVMRADGSKITYLRAFGRFWATVLSALTLCIGYIMAGFTNQKKALHDMVADTRVVYAKSM
ncbi:MAG: RDD family protein [Rickettsiales bacterium]|nr:RDD family protein [Pseudomonadota bacterium]MDA0967286.1 RDD family protein [Pseudomonadota bacterium]MDG4544053.1 RDD family protein [Rickettsiales bacterium]MDG4546253.1 RDD family protein [Rickettsiales bacterium]MDG4548377.1 RDD family protein [Rickettsiales bacterium]